MVKHLITKHCERCGKEVTRNASGFKAKHIYCSKKCSGKTKAVIITKKCEWCGKDVTRKSYLFNNRHVFCGLPAKCSHNYVSFYRKDRIFLCSREDYKPLHEMSSKEKSARRIENNKRVLIRMGITNPTCKRCGIPITPNPENVKKGMGEFCSLSCAAQYRWDNNQGNYNRRRKVARTCKYCGNDFKVWPSQVDIGWGIYCSRACRIADNLIPEGQRMYCEKFTPEFREGVRAFFGYVCAECGTTQEANKAKLSVHHVYYNKKSCCAQDDNGNYIHTLPGEIKVLVKGDPNKFVPLCKHCHTKTNGGKNTPRLYWALHFEEIINTYYGGKSWLTPEERVTKIKIIQDMRLIILDPYPVNQPLSSCSEPLSF